MGSGLNGSSYKYRSHLSRPEIFFLSFFLLSFLSIIQFLTQRVSDFYPGGLEESLYIY